MSKIQIFIDNFETLSLAKLNFYNGKVIEYKTARASAIAITYGKVCSWPYKNAPDSDGVYRRDPTVSTVGDLFKFIYPNPEGGGERVFPNDPTNLGDVFSELKDPDTGAKPLAEILTKTYGASRQVKLLNILRKHGGKKWFDAFMSSALAYLKSEKKETKDWNEETFMNQFDNNDEYLSLIETTDWTYNIINDINNNKSKSKNEEDAIDAIKEIRSIQKMRPTIEICARLKGKINLAIMLAPVARVDRMTSKTL
jgi:hypothetical protein